MKKAVVLVALCVLALGAAHSVDAHQSGCHRWHSCPSDTGSYTCGDTGYCSQCGDNSYCHNGTYARGWNELKTDTNPPPITAAPAAFVGVPKTHAQVRSCLVVGNHASMIYHLKGSRYIRSMTLRGKECFATEGDAIAKGFRKALAR